MVYPIISLEPHSRKRTRGAHTTPETNTMISTTDNFTISADDSSPDIITDEPCPYIRLFSGDGQPTGDEMHSKITAPQCLTVEDQKRTVRDIKEKMKSLIEPMFKAINVMPRALRKATVYTTMLALLRIFLFPVHSDKQSFTIAEYHDQMADDLERFLDNIRELDERFDDSPPSDDLVREGWTLLLKATDLTAKCANMALREVSYQASLWEQQHEHGAKKTPKETDDESLSYIQPPWLQGVDENIIDRRHGRSLSDNPAPQIKRNLGGLGVRSKRRMPPKDNFDIVLPRRRIYNQRRTSSKQVNRECIEQEEKTEEHQNPQQTSLSQVQDVSVVPSQFTTSSSKWSRRIELQRQQSIEPFPTSLASPKISFIVPPIVSIANIAQLGRKAQLPVCRSWDEFRNRSSIQPEQWIEDGGAIIEGVTHERILKLFSELRFPQDSVIAKLRLEDNALDVLHKARRLAINPEELNKAEERAAIALSMLEKITTQVGRKFSLLLFWELIEQVRTRAAARARIIKKKVTLQHTEDPEYCKYRKTYISTTGGTKRRCFLELSLSRITEYFTNVRLHELAWVSFGAVIKTAKGRKIYGENRRKLLIKWRQRRQNAETLMLEIKRFGWQVLIDSSINVTTIHNKEMQEAVAKFGAPWHAPREHENSGMIEVFKQCLLAKSSEERADILRVSVPFLPRRKLSEEPAVMEFSDIHIEAHGKCAKKRDGDDDPEESLALISPRKKRNIKQ